MATEIRNRKGFKVLKIDRKELLQKMFIYGCLGVCDHCLDTPDTGYFVVALNHWICPSCYQKWMDHAVFYPEDMKYELKKYEHWCVVFGDNLNNE